MRHYKHILLKFPTSHFHIEGRLQGWNGCCTLGRCYQVWPGYETGQVSHIWTAENDPMQISDEIIVSALMLKHIICIRISLERIDTGIWYQRFMDRCVCLTAVVGMVIETLHKCSIIPISKKVHCSSSFIYYSNSSLHCQLYLQTKYSPVNTPSPFELISHSVHVYK